MPDIDAERRQMTPVAPDHSAVTRARDAMLQCLGVRRGIVVRLVLSHDATTGTHHASVANDDPEVFGQGPTEDAAVLLLCNRVLAREQEHFRRYQSAFGRLLVDTNRASITTNPRSTSARERFGDPSGT